MKKLSLILLLGFVLGLVASSWAHFPEGVTYMAYQFPTGKEPKIDGKIDDWAMVGSSYIVNTEDWYEQLAGMGKNGSGVDLSDANFRLITGWSPSKNSIYVVFQAFDNVKVVQDIAKGDKFSLYFDSDHSGGQYDGFTTLTADEQKRYNGAGAQKLNFAYPTLDQQYMGVVYESNVWYALPTAKTNPQSTPYIEFGGDFKGTINGEGTTIGEVRIGPIFDDLDYHGPDMSKVHNLKESDIIGYNITYSDYDDPTPPLKYHAYWNLSGTDAVFQFSERLADLLMAPLETSSTPVESSTWGRIKASFLE